jgi:hypothetical protein
MPRSARANAPGFAVFQTLQSHARLLQRHQNATIIKHRFAGLARFSREEASDRIPSLVDFITITRGFRLGAHTGLNGMTTP